MPKQVIQHYREKYIVAETTSKRLAKFKKRKQTVREHEWDIYGMCSSLNQFDFFKLALDLYVRNDLKAILRNAKISLGGTYGQSTIINTIKEVISVEPQLKCYLEEISLCLNTSIIPRYINCLPGRRKCLSLAIFP
ncbi:Intracellular ribonuclease LX, partial [Mucuna pruriens]